MECHTIRPRIGSYLDQALRESELKEVAAHLKHCLKCAVHFEQLKEIEAMIHSELYGQPPEEYWQELPGAVSNRLGLRQQINPVRVGIVDSIAELFTMPRVRWGIAGVMALLLIVLLANFPTLHDDSSVVSNKPILPESLHDDISAKERVDDVAIKTPVSDSEAQQMLVNTDNRTEERGADETTDSPVPAAGTVVDEISLPDESAVVKLSGRSPRLNTGGDYQPEFNKELIPLPAPEIHVADETPDKNSISDNPPVVNTLSLDTGAETQKSAANSILVNEFGFENSFVEIKDIVDESLTLDEKKNIWLSYINREPNSTYRSLAIYHLALVFYDIAEQSGEFEDAKTALDLFKKHESALRQQIGKNGFEARLNALDLMMLE